MEKIDENYKVLSKKVNDNHDEIKEIIVNLTKQVAHPAKLKDVEGAVEE